MSGPDGSGETTGGTGATTGAGGTPFPVDLSQDRQARGTWVVFLAGPMIWFLHFMVVYLVAEAGCTGDGPGLELLDPPVPRAATLLATAVAVVACLGFAARGYRRWRANAEPGAGAVESLGGAGDGGGRASLAFSGMLLSVLSALAVLLVGLPALFLPTC